MENFHFLYTIHRNERSLFSVHWEHPADLMIDIDGFIFLLNRSEKLCKDSDIIFYNNAHGAVELVGGFELEPDRGESVFYFDFSKIPDYVEKIILRLAIYDAANNDYHFGQVENICLKLVVGDICHNEYDMDLALNDANEKEICWHFDKKFENQRVLDICEISRCTPDEWVLHPLGIGHDETMEMIFQQYGIDTY